MVAKWCPGHQGLVLPNEFYGCRKNGFQRRCRECVKAERREAYWRFNREREIAKARAWQLAHPERKREIDRGVRERIKQDPERLAIKRDQQRESTRRRRGITPDRYRYRPPGKPERLPAGPFQAWLEGRSDLGALARLVAPDRQPTMDRYLRNAQAGDFATVPADLVERVLAAAGADFSEVYAEGLDSTNLVP